LQYVIIDFEQIKYNPRTKTLSSKSVLSQNQTTQTHHDNTAKTTAKPAITAATRATRATY
jgi:hypothetical protein